MRLPSRLALCALAALGLTLALSLSGLPLRAAGVEGGPAPTDDQPFVITATPTPDADVSNSAYDYAGDVRGDKERTIPIHKAGGLRHSRHDVSGFTLYEVGHTDSRQRVP